MHCCRHHDMRVSVVVLFVSFVVPCLAHGDPVELLPNAGCEKINDKMQPSYFGVQNAGEIISIPESRKGQRAVRLVAKPHEWNFSVFATPNPGSNPQDNVLKINVAKGGLYRASAWVRGKGVFRLGVQQWPSILGSKMSEPLTLNREWQQVQLEFHADQPDVLSTNLLFRIDGDGAIADVDDVSFTFDSKENVGIEHFAPVPKKALRIRLESRQARDVEVLANGKPVALTRNIGRFEIEEGLVSLAVRAVPTGINAGIRLRLEGHPEIEGRWRASSRADPDWQLSDFDDRSWPVVTSDKEGYMWSSDWKGFSRTKPSEMFFRQILLWNDTHFGPNRCILPQAKKWGVSRGGMENLTLALYSPLPYSLSDYEFVLDVPEGFELFGKAGDYYTRYVLNQKPDRIVEEQLVRDGTPHRRYRFFHSEGQVCGATSQYQIFTQYSILPVRLDRDFAGEAAEFRFRRQAKGNFTELEQRIPVQILPPINGRQPKRFMISAYVGIPTGYSALSPEHLSAFVRQIAAAGWTHVSVSVSSPGCPGWGPEWLAYQQRYLALCRANGIQGILWPWNSFPITGSYVQNTVPTTLRDWVEVTPDAKARYYKDTPPENDKEQGMYCPTFVATKGSEQFRTIVKDVWSGMITQMGSTDIIWTDDERFIFTPDGTGSSCFCDRCKTAFRIFAKLPVDADLSDEAIFTRHNAQWRLFWADVWFRGVHAELRKAANELGKQYMIYTWNGSNDLWRAAGGNMDIAFPGMPGSNVMSASGQKTVDDSMAFYRKELGLNRVQGQSFGVMNAGVQKNAWAMQQVISRDGFVDAKSWKSQVLRMAATLQGGVDLGETPIDYAAGSYFWIGEATRIIAAFEDLFYEGVRCDALVASEQIAYPNILVLVKGTERLVLLFNERDEDLAVTLKNLNLEPGQRAQVFEQEAWADAATVDLTIPPRDAAVIHVK